VRFCALLRPPASIAAANMPHRNTFKDLGDFTVVLLQWSGPP
jgi:hypothetical protein